MGSDLGPHADANMVVVVFFATLLPSRRAAGITPLEAPRDG
jgi:ABC-type lipoprotein release transport system permease subunit